jgi:pectin methylesterase-like acyl-CoA thioesterase
MHGIVNTLDLSRRILMKRVVMVVALAGVIFVGVQALAVDSTSQPTMSKRQMIAQMVGCMRKRMSANKNTSYNDAMKACKDQISKQSDSFPSGALVASGTPAKP